jgi:hypothetical protein
MRNEQPCGEGYSSTGYHAVLTKLVYLGKQPVKTLYAKGLVVDHLEFCLMADTIMYRLESLA